MILRENFAWGIESPYKVDWQFVLRRGGLAGWAWFWLYKTLPVKNDKSINIGEDYEV